MNKIKVQKLQMNIVKEGEKCTEIIKSILTNLANSTQIFKLLSDLKRLLVFMTCFLNLSLILQLSLANLLILLIIDTIGAQLFLSKFHEFWKFDFEGEGSFGGQGHISKQYLNSPLRVYFLCPTVKVQTWIWTKFSTSTATGA
jgi:hypothetical protein